MAPLDELQQLYNDSDFLIVGDFNEDLLCKSSNIKDFFNSRDSGSLLDHSYIKTRKYTVSSSVTDTYYTDHDFVSVYFS